MKIIYIIVTYILAFLGLFILAFGTVELTQFYNAKAWPAQLGVITESKAVKSYAKNRRWRHTIKGNYVLSGRVFTIRRISFNEIGKRTFDHGKSYSKRSVSKYSVGKEVLVYASADNPEFTILEPEPKQGYLHAVVLVGGLFVLNFIIYLLFFRGRSNKSN